MRARRALGAALVAGALAAPALLAQATHIDRGEPPPRTEVDLDAWRSRAPTDPGGGVALTSTSAEYAKARDAAALEELGIRLAWERLQLDYERKRLAQRSATFAWQHNSSILIFWLVTLIVVSGLGLSFWHVYRKETAPTKIVVGDKGIELSSRLVGVLVFVLSLAFFYLYLQQVYPISEVGAKPAPAAAQDGS